jgi:hypothetical protein
MTVVENYAQAVEAKAALEAEIRAMAAGLSKIVDALLRAPLSLLTEPSTRHVSERPGESVMALDDSSERVGLSDMVSADRMRAILLKLRNADKNVKGCFNALSPTERSIVQARSDPPRRR